MSQGFGTPPQTAQSGSGAILSWATGTAYVQGQPVTNSGHTYTANDAHTAGATFAGDLVSHWTLLPLTAADVGAQPVDSDLTAIAALTTTSYGRAFLALADAAAGRTALGLGTAATQASGAFDAAGAAAAAQTASQPLDSDLTAIAALTTTSYGRSLLTLADAAAARAAFGLSAVQSFEQAGALTTGVGVGRFRFPVAATIIDVAATVNTAPTGQAIKVDVNKNGTTVFTTQANRPSIAAAGNASTDAVPDVTAIAAGDYLTVDIDQVGSGVTGSDLVVVVHYRLVS